MSIYWMETHIYAVGGCDDVFREAIENATPGTYAFRDINIV